VRHFLQHRRKKAIPEIGQAGRETTRLGECVDPPEEGGRKRCVPGRPVVLGEELGLVACHVHSHRALRLARLALQAEVERLENLLALHPRQIPAHRLPQRVRPAAGRMFLFQGDLERRAHGPGIQLPADAHPVAFLHRDIPPTVFRVVVERFGRSTSVGLAEPQVIGHSLVRRHDLPARIHQPVGIECLLDFTVQLQNLGAEHQRQELGAGKTIAVLTGKRAPELDHQIRDLTGDRLHSADVIPLLQVQVHADVQTSLARMAEEAERRAVPVYDLLEPPRIGP
jgi:hypothetical protein